MVSIDIEAQITEALAGREEQIPFVESLTARWDNLASQVSTLSAAAADLAREAAATRAPDSGHTTLFRDLTGYLAPGGDWQKRAAALSSSLTGSAAKLGVLHRRVTRKTVNIGVIGSTGAGKSTLLRQLSGLDERQIPSNKYDSSTATPSRIFHRSGSGEGSATLHLHTRQSFLAEVITPLHEKAKLPAPAPLSIDEFRRFRYPKDSARDRDAEPERFILRLIVAQDSLPSYEHLLRGGEEEIDLSDLRPYVAYPEPKTSRVRPYHAVRSVDIFCPFPRVGVVSLGLVDLPGSGEAALDVHRRFLDQLRNEADLLFLVKRPTTERGEEQDWEITGLAQDAAAGVRREDFAHLVINRDARLDREEFRYRAEQAAKTASHLGSNVLSCDILQNSADQVSQAILAPTLEHIARRLRDMDRDAIAFVLADLADIAAQARDLASDLVQHLGGLQRSIPDEERQYRVAVIELINKVNGNLLRVTKVYDELRQVGAPLAEFHQEIERAGQAVRRWQADGLGDDSTDSWLEKFEQAFGIGEGRELDRRYNATRKEIVKEFAGIDASLEAAIHRLWDEVAKALRQELKHSIVPPGQDGGAALKAFAATAEQAEAAKGGAPALYDAAEDLLNLQSQYGSIFLRVGRPIVREIWWLKDDPAADASAQAAPRIAAPRASAAGFDDAEPWFFEDDQDDAGIAAQPAYAPPAAAIPGLDDPLAKKYPRAWAQYVRLCSIIEWATSELEREFREEATRILVVLAAAIDKFRDSTVAEPGIEVEWERLCRPAQREIWPEKFAQGAANVTATMAALHQQASKAENAATDVVALVSRAGSLSSAMAAVSRMEEGDDR